MKVFADNKFPCAPNIEVVYERVENTVGKGENTNYQHFRYVPNLFSCQLASSSGLLNTGLSGTALPNNKI